MRFLSVAFGTSPPHAPHASCFGGPCPVVYVIGTGWRRCTPDVLAGVPINDLPPYTVLLFFVSLLSGPRLALAALIFGPTCRRPAGLPVAAAASRRSAGPRHSAGPASSLMHPLPPQDTSPAVPARHFSGVMVLARLRVGQLPYCAFCCAPLRGACLWTTRRENKQTTPLHLPILSVFSGFSVCLQSARCTLTSAR